MFYTCRVIINFSVFCKNSYKNTPASMDVLIRFRILIYEFLKMIHVKTLKRKCILQILLSVFFHFNIYSEIR